MAYRHYAGKACLGAVLHGLDEIGIPLRIVEIVTVGQDTVFYLGKPLATYKWLALDPENPAFVSAVFAFNDSFTDMNMEHFKYVQLYTDGSVKPRLVLDKDGVPAVFVEELTPQVISYLDGFFEPTIEATKLMLDAGMMFSLSRKGAHIKFRKPEGIKAVLAHMQANMRWK